MLNITTSSAFIEHLATVFLRDFSICCFEIWSSIFRTHYTSSDPRYWFWLFTNTFQTNVCVCVCMFVSNPSLQPCRPENVCFWTHMAAWQPLDALCWLAWSLNTMVTGNGGAAKALCGGNKPPPRLLSQTPWRVSLYPQGHRRWWKPPACLG